MNDDFTLADLAALDAIGVLADGADRARYETLLLAADADEKQDASFARESTLLLAESLEPVAPPAALKAEILRKVGKIADDAVPEESRTIRSDEGRWIDHPVRGVRIKELSFDAGRGLATILMELAPGAIFPPHDHHGAEECYVLRGACGIGNLVVREGDFHHVGAGTHHGALHSEEGCLLLLVVDKEDYLVA